MTEKLTPTTVETPAETAVIDPETLDEGDTPAETAGEVKSPTIQRLEEARQHLSDLLDAHEAPSSDEEAGEPTPETDESSDKSEDTPEKKEKRNKNFLKKMGSWAVMSLEANGFIPRRGTWHKRDGVTGFIAKAYVLSKQQKAQRVAGFLSPEANAQLNGDTKEGETSPEATSDDHETDDKEQVRLHRRMGRGALTLARRTARAPKTAYKTFKAIKNVK
jgi:hypothetical protein